MTTKREIIGTVVARGCEVVAQIEVYADHSTSSYYLGDRGFAGEQFWGAGHEEKAMHHARSEAARLLAGMRGKLVVTGMIDA